MGLLWRKSKMYYNEFQQLTVKHFINWAKTKPQNVVFYSGPNLNGSYIHLVTPLKCNLLDPSYRILRPHLEAYKLTSSQVMCLNFFEPFLGLITSDTTLLFREFLNEIRKQLNDVSSSVDVNDVLESYEYERDFCSSSIDLYIKTIGGYEFFCEIKYTEKEFGSFKGEAKNQTYVEKMLDVFNRKFKKSYDERQRFINETNHSGWLRDFFGIKDSESEKKKISYDTSNLDNLKYSNYQINRNVILANSDKKFTLFIYPFIREDISLELDNYKNQKNVVLLDWKELSSRFIEASSEKKVYCKYYTDFVEKYIWW